MIVTLTLNPSLDRTVEVPFLERGGVIRALSGRLDPGGKGVNVARVLLANGFDAKAVFPVGGHVGREMTGLLASAGVPMIAVEVASETRSNITLSEPDGTVTKINETGGAITVADLDRLHDVVVTASRPDGWVVASGSLPPGAPEDAYARLVAGLAEKNVRVAIDTSGPALRGAVAARPALVKPNRSELAEAVGAEVRNLADAVDAAETLRAEGADAVLVSLGPDGAVLVDGDGVIFGSSPISAARSSVGAGDCLLAGFVASGARGESALATALRWAGAAVERPGSDTPGPGQIDGRPATVRRDIDRRQLLTPSP